MLLATLIWRDPKEPFAVLLGNEPKPRGAAEVAGMGKWWQKWENVSRHSRQHRSSFGAWSDLTGPSISSDLSKEKGRELQGLVHGITLTYFLGTADKIKY